MVISLRKFKAVLLLIAMASTCLVSIACKSQETDLFFETIEKLDGGGTAEHETYLTLESRVILVTRQQEIDQLDGLVTPEARDELTQLDFGKYFAIAVFRGLQASSRYDTFVERVVRQGDKIIVYVQFWEPSPYWTVTAANTSPYHLIKVRRDNGPIQETAVALQSRILTPTPPAR